LTTPLYELPKIRPKITAILRTRAYYSVPDLVTQLKTHIWGLIEVNMGGYFHAASYMLAKIDHAQNRFLTLWVFHLTKRSLILILPRQA